MTIKKVDFYLPPQMLLEMSRGKKHRFFSIARQAFVSIGLEVNLVEDSDENRQESIFKDAYALFHFKNPFHERSIDARPAYIGPFYKLENQTYREDFRTTKMAFKPQKVNQEVAKRFYEKWAPGVCKKMGADFATLGSVLIALQGRLLERRIGQSMSPVDMIKTVLAHEKCRLVFLKKHPKESYSEEELDTLNAFCDEPRVQFAEGDLEPILAKCDYVVTQNSSVALKGLFFKKPAILFAHCEFHHAFQSVVYAKSAENCFENVLIKPLEYEKFLFWYLRENCVNTSRGFAKEQIVGQCRELGWKI